MMTLATVAITIAAWELFHALRHRFLCLHRSTREACYIVTGILAVVTTATLIMGTVAWYKSRSIAASLESLGELEVVEIATPYLNVETGDYSAVQMTLQLADGNQSRFHVYGLNPHNMPRVGDVVRLTTAGRFSWSATLADR